MHLHLLSNSRMPGDEPLAWAIDRLVRDWGGRVKTAAMVPFAGVALDWDEYTDWVAGAMSPHGIKLIGAHQDDTSIETADAIFVGGGNTFHLAYHLTKSGLFERIKDQVIAGKPYLSWSAGSNVAAPTLRTTNDMPIVEPPSFKTFGFVPFQINPHYSPIVPSGHLGETRDQRLYEFITANPDDAVIGLPEGAMIIVNDGITSAWGTGPLRVFNSEQPHGIDVAIDDFAG